MGNGVMKGTKTLGPVWAGSERSGEPAQTAAIVLINLSENNPLQEEDRVRDTGQLPQEHESHAECSRGYRGC